MIGLYIPHIPAQGRYKRGSARIIMSAPSGEAVWFGNSVISALTEVTRRWLAADRLQAPRQRTEPFTKSRNDASACATSFGDLAHSEYGV